MWPGATRSSGREVGDAKVLIVLQRSSADTPVVIPAEASYGYTT